MFYTYLWLREDGTPYYVGKGTRYRGFSTGSHLVPHPSSREFIITQHHPSEKAALTAEAFFIEFYGRKDLGTGCLVNFTNGGVGATGRKISEETKRKIGEANKGNTARLGHKWSEEMKRRIGAASEGRIPNAAARKKMSEAHAGFKHSEETKLYLSRLFRGRPISYACRLAVAESNRQRAKARRQSAERLAIKTSLQPV
jgi:hypothetical protein